MLIGQSGGPTAVINGSLYGAIKEALASKNQIASIYGMVNGIEGFLNNQYIALADLEDTNDLELLRTTPGAYLGSCRYKLPEDLNDKIFKTLFEKFEALNIGYFFYIGGNDSMDTVSKLSRYANEVASDIRFIGIPKTIDNDLVLTDHTPGFGSAAKYVATVVREIVIDASVYDNKTSVTIVEIMGRHAGWLTAASALARRFEGDNPVLIYLPEAPFQVEDFLAKVKQSLKSTPNLVICISEGINDGQGTFVCEYEGAVNVDAFGHKMLTGSGKYLENLIKEKLGIKVRSVELNVMQRCSSLHLSATDLKEAINSGVFAVQVALRGESGKMITFNRHHNNPYELTYGIADVDLICNEEKAVPANWITKEGSDISHEFIEYAKPLIDGEVTLPRDGGLPLFTYRKH